jgi:hypothetical protein
VLEEAGFAKAPPVSSTVEPPVMTGWTTVKLQVLTLGRATTLTCASNSTVTFISFNAEPVSSLVTVIRYFETSPGLMVAGVNC